MTKSMTKAEIREELRGLGVEMSNSEFKATKKGELMNMLNEAKDTTKEETTKEVIKMDKKTNILDQFNAVLKDTMSNMFAKNTAEVKAHTTTESNRVVDEISKKIDAKIDNAVKELKGATANRGSSNNYKANNRQVSNPKQNGIKQYNKLASTLKPIGTEYNEKLDREINVFGKCSVCACNITSARVVAFSSLNIGKVMCQDCQNKARKTVKSGGRKSISLLDKSLLDVKEACEKSKLSLVKVILHSSNNNEFKMNTFCNTPGEVKEFVKQSYKGLPTKARVEVKENYVILRLKGETIVANEPTRTEDEQAKVDHIHKTIELKKKADEEKAQKVEKEKEELAAKREEEHKETDAVSADESTISQDDQVTLEEQYNKMRAEESAQEDNSNKDSNESTNNEEVKAPSIDWGNVPYVPSNNADDNAAF